MAVAIASVAVAIASAYVDVAITSDAGTDAAITSVAGTVVATGIVVLSWIAVSGCWTEHTALYHLLASDLLLPIRAQLLQSVL